MVECLAFVKALAKLETIAHRHHQVGDDEMWHNFCRQGKTFLAVGGVIHIVMALELRADVVGNILVVLHHQHRGQILAMHHILILFAVVLIVELNHRSILQFAKRQCLCRRGEDLAQRELHGESGAHAHSAIDAHIAIHAGHHLLHQCQAHA